MLGKSSLQIVLDLVKKENYSFNPSSVNTPFLDFLSFTITSPIIINANPYRGYTPAIISTTGIIAVSNL